MTSKQIFHQLSLAQKKKYTKLFKLHIEMREIIIVGGRIVK